MCFLEFYPNKKDLLWILGIKNAAIKAAALERWHLVWHLYLVNSKTNIVGGHFFHRILAITFDKVRRFVTW